MSMYRTFLAFAILTAASPALADPAADKAQSDTLPDDVANRFVEFFDKLTVIVVDNEKDCTRMAAGVNAHVDENEALLKLVTEAKSQHKSLPQAARDKIAKKSVDALAPAMMKKCSNDRAVINAFMRINPVPKSPSEIAEKEKKKAERIERKKRKNAANK